MRKIIVMAALITGAFGAGAQNRSDYVTAKGEQPDEVIYLGPCSFEDIGKVKAFDLDNKAAAYQPDPKVEALLKDKLPGYQMVIYLGTWCDDSHRLIPQLYRLLEDVRYPMDALQIYGLDHAKKGKAGEEKQYDILHVPTIILVKDGKEQGRITEVVDKSIESDLLKIIEQK